LSGKEIRQIAWDLGAVKETGKFPKGRGHMYTFYKKQGVVTMGGYVTLGSGKSKVKYLGPKSKAKLTRKGYKMYNQLKGVL